MPEDVLTAVEAWSTSQDDMLNRSQAIVRLVAIGLTVKPALRPSPNAAARAAELASKVIDKHLDPNASADDRETRRRKLLHGPSVFRDVRKDKPK